MKTINATETQPDPVISELRAVKRAIIADHGGDLDAFFAGLRARQANNPQLVKTTSGEQGVTRQSTTR